MRSEPEIALPNEDEQNALQLLAREVSRLPLQGVEGGGKEGQAS
jgi:hypothetical protein